jgi:hypothetical protein
MAGLFELNQRYLEIKHKSETLLDMTDVFSSLSNARRSARLEWIIIHSDRHRDHHLPDAAVSRALNKFRLLTAEAPLEAAS